MLTHRQQKKNNEQKRIKQNVTTLRHSIKTETECTNNTNTHSIRHARAQFYVSFREYALMHVRLLLVGILLATTNVNGQSAPKRNRTERQPGRLGRCEPLERCDWYDGGSSSWTRDIGTTASATNDDDDAQAHMRTHACARTYVRCIYSSALKTLRSLAGNMRARVRTRQHTSDDRYAVCARKCHHAPLCTAAVGYGRTHTNIYIPTCNVSVGARVRDLLIKKYKNNACTTCMGYKKAYWYERDRLGVEGFSWMYVMDKCAE